MAGFDVVTTLLTTLLLGFETILIAVATAVIEAQTGTIFLLIVPFCGVRPAWSGILRLITGATGADYRSREVSLRHRKQTNANVFTFLFAVESVLITTTAGVLELGADACAYFIVKSIKATTAVTVVLAKITNFAGFALGYTSSGFTLRSVGVDRAKSSPEYMLIMRLLRRANSKALMRLSLRMLLRSRSMSLVELLRMSNTPEASRINQRVILGEFR